MALALVHHIVLAEGIPFRQFAAFLHAMLKDGGMVLLEFVPPDDSQVQRMTAAKPGLLDSYSLQAMRESFAPFFREKEKILLEGTSRILFVFAKK